MNEIEPRFTFNQKKIIRDTIKTLTKDNTILLYKIIKQDNPSPNIIYDKNKVLLNFNELKNTTLFKINNFLKNLSDKISNESNESNESLFIKNKHVEPKKICHNIITEDISLFSYYIKNKDIPIKKEKEVVPFKKKVSNFNNKEKITIDKDIHKYIMDSYLGYETAGKDFSIYNIDDTYNDTDNDTCTELSTDTYYETDTDTEIESDIESNLKFENLSVSDVNTENNTESYIETDEENN